MDRRVHLVVALATVYLVWGSTYLAIKVGLDGFPPMALGALRFFFAGVILYGLAAGRGARATRREWRAAALAGTLMLVGGNGSVTWAEQRIDSGIAALLVATVPLWMTFLAWAWQRQPLPWRTVVGLAMGFAGVALLVRPSGGGRDVVAAAIVVGGALLWAVGSLYVRQAPLPGNALRATAMQMLSASAAFTLLSVVAGEPARFDVAGLTWPAVAALAYLVVFGSVIAFSAYTWLLRAASPSTVSTYAYVNPVVAVLLGAAILGEAVTGVMLAAGGLVLLGVVLIVARRRPRARQESGGVRRTHYVRPQPRLRRRPRREAAAWSAASIARRPRSRPSLP